MSGYRDKGFSDRLSTAELARKAMQQRFQSRDGMNDPALAERRAARQAVSAARETRLAEREATKLAERTRAAEARAREAQEQEARETAERALRLEQEAREAVEQAERQAALEIDQKAARDARYAARKARK